MSLTVDEAVAISLERSFRVQRSERNAEIADLQVDNARAGLRPRFDSHLRVGQSQSYSEFSGSSHRFTDLTPDFSASVNAVASMPIDIWGVTKRRVEQAENARDSVNINLEQSALEVAVQVRSNYVRALQSKGRTDANRAVLREIETLIDRASSEQPSIVPFLESERDLATQQLNGSETEFELAVARLTQSMRVPTSTHLVLESDLPQPIVLPSDDRLFAIASQNRTDLRQAEINLDQARLRRDQAEDVRRPTLGVDLFADQGVTGRSPLFGDRDSGRSLAVGVAARLDIPLLQYDGGILRNSRKVADIQAEQALADHAEAFERTENELDQLLISLKRLRERLDTLPDINLAESSLRTAERALLAASPSGASATLAQVTNARENLRRARLARTDTLAEYDSNVILLSRAIGRDLYE
ncbi:MAG TPA: TolC family protein [Sphingomicrobium sp.]|nr:TolC family protein [Sphingomicrobium sp.]